MAITSPDARSTSSHRIPKPSPDRPPLRANVFEAMQYANTSLAPMFPTYLERGSIVPCATLFIGGPDAEFGHFFHENTEEEVALVMADNKAHKGTGTVMIAPLHHGVNSFLKDPKDPESFLLIMITQRQRDRDAQSERILFRCKCNEVLFDFGFDATPPDTFEAGVDKILITTRESSAAAEAFNADENLRTCKRCGTVAAPFPITPWGWTQHTAQYRAVARARSILTAAANGDKP
jgi:hypothetical protein